MAVAANGSSGIWAGWPAALSDLAPRAGLASWRRGYTSAHQSRACGPGGRGGGGGGGGGRLARPWGVFCPSIFVGFDSTTSSFFTKTFLFHEDLRGVCIHEVLFHSGRLKATQSRNRLGSAGGFEYLYVSYDPCSDGVPSAGFLAQVLPGTRGHLS
jgi:hypothetical protein